MVSALTVQGLDEVAASYASYADLAQDPYATEGYR
jgi:hypothetical protein